MVEYNIFEHSCEILCVHLGKKLGKKQNIQDIKEEQNTPTLQKNVLYNANPINALKTIIIPHSLQEQFECVVDKHVFIDNPWKKISRAKIIENITSQNKKSCFWEFREELRKIKKEHILVSYKSSNYTDEEFVICLTDQAIEFIETQQTQLENGLKERVEKSMVKFSGAWESGGTENEIEEMIPVRIREKLYIKLLLTVAASDPIILGRLFDFQLTFKWKVPTDRLQAKANFEDSNSKSIRNQYVELIPRSNEIFEISDRLLKDSSVQTTLLNHKETQTVSKIYQNKSIQFIAVEEDMFQPQLLIESDIYLKSFFEKHVPYFENELHQNQLYDLYRDDYKLLKNKNDKSYIRCTKDIKLLPGAYHNVAFPKKYVSSYTWHPTIPGIFALTYMTSSNGLYKRINIENPAEKMAKLTIKERDKLKCIDDQNNFVVIWSISDMIFPKLKLESFEEVCCVEFSPIDGNIVVGGLNNGLISIWDIKGKLNNTLRGGECCHEELCMQLENTTNLTTDLKSEHLIKLTALSAIIESHTSMVTAIQWIHPLNEITPFGKLVNTEEGNFSLQFFAASLDGTVKLWDLNSTLPVETNKKKTENFNKYNSPLSVYNNRLKPLYTITITDIENVITPTSPIIPITALSFNIPLLKYTTSNEPLIFGESQFQYVPTAQNKSDRLLVIGTIMGQVGVVTWNGFGADYKGKLNEKCKPNWWGQVHDGPVTCIRRNMFYPDIYLKLPLWYKEFNNLTNSVLWSAVHPAEFRVSFNNGGELQFWDFKKYTHQPYQIFNYTLGGGLIATMSSPCLPVHFVDAQQGEALTDYRNKELICFADSAGEIRMITVEKLDTESDEEKKMGQMLQNRVNQLKQSDQYNEKCKETLQPQMNYNDDKSTALSLSFESLSKVIHSYKQYKIEQGKEYYRQYLERNPWSRLVKIRDEEDTKKRNIGHITRINNK
ncbi:WD40/YVTN repeat-like-containing domain,WD40 repeat,WD40-repeat-containing domain [Cinara cedri]|uniref:WD40/YVTN repeat-like-containing domain,WD40 repeat,WD40-repeat-containing domain n=1 Tax=Cinara cedri TaxID=506608 RepID=A0A5E4NAC1_9HEMI|nr:WD40/YVTN repeat-like-containing domain,WD40 repeat,WD40-repeat-containing domain [Cinara cedri]